MAKVINRIDGPQGATWRIRDNAGELEIYLNGNWVTETEIAAVTDGSASYVNVTDATAYTVLAANSGKVHIVPDLTADCTISLPTAAAGLRFKFVYGGGAADAHDWLIDTGADANFYIGGVVQHDPDNAGDDTVVYYGDGDSNSKLGVLTPQAGTTIEVICDGTNWTIVEGRVISATDAGVTFADQ